MKKIFFAFFLLATGFSTAQDISIEQTISYINGKIAPGCSIDVSKGNIIAIYKEDGQLTREDETRIADLDLNSMFYNETYRIFSINCKGAPGKKCVARDLPGKGDKTKAWYLPYARMSWEVTLDRKSAEGLKNAFTHLVRRITEPKYSSSEPFE